MRNSTIETCTETDMPVVRLDQKQDDAASTISLVSAAADSQNNDLVESARAVDVIMQPEMKNIEVPESREPDAIITAPTLPTDMSNDVKDHDESVSIAGGISIADDTSSKNAPVALASLPESGPGLDGQMTYTWLKDLNSRVSSLEVDIKTTKNDSSETKTAKPTDTPEAPEAYMSRTIAKVRECTWEEFKNYFPDDKGVHAIEVLADSRGLDEEIEAEQLKRLTPAKKLEVLAARNKSRRAQPKDIIGPRRLQRVRINSAHVLAVLANVAGEKWAKKPHTFLRPFRFLLHFHDKMEAEYRRLEESLATRGAKVAASSPGPLAAPDMSEKETEITPAPLVIDSDGKTIDPGTATPIEEGRRKAYDDMTCYIDFMRTQLVPIHTMFDTVDLSKPRKVRYHDLSSLFRVGELVLVQSTDKSANWVDRDEAKSTPGNQQSADASQNNTTEPLVGKIFYMQFDALDWEVNDLADAGSGGTLRQDGGFDDKQSTSLSFYHIDHNGEELRASYNRYSISWFGGEKDIASLALFPLRFSKDHQQILQDLEKRGQKFQNILSQSTKSSLSYQGRTLDRTPLGHELGTSVYIDSDIIVDFREAYSLQVGWKPTFHSYTKDNVVPSITDDKFDIIRWGGKDRKEILRRDSEVVIYDDAIHSVECDYFLDTLDARFLLDREDRTSEQKAAGDYLSAEDLVMLPSRVFAYALRERKFISANVRHVKLNPRLEASSTFEQLRISDKHKRLIQSVVYEHFQKKDTQKQGIAKDLKLSDQDFIRGKGRGLVILLHGAPGVGKTATAEAVSYAYNKPLFPITCGNLGIEPEDVEDNLTELFRLANLWDCILLLDEAEIFLSPRAKTDDNLQRNALVSVFLRILEYYSGVLFLTTNRSGALDEAVKSRVHLSLLYPHLGYNETMSLFKMNIERLEQIERETKAITGKEAMTIETDGIMGFAERHFEKFQNMEDSRWNGRQIRNAFQIAASLARYQSHSQPHRGLYVGPEHFQEVEDATADYDDFRNRTRFGKTDGEIAWDRGERGPDHTQPPSSAPDWRLNANQGPNFNQHRSSRHRFRQETSTTPQTNKNWAPSPNARSYPQGGGPARDSANGEFGGSPSWSSTGGQSASVSYQGQRRTQSPHGSVSTEVGGGYTGRDHEYRNPAGQAPSTPVPYQAQRQNQGPVFSPQGSALAGKGDDNGWQQQYRGPEGGGPSTPTPSQAHRPAPSPHQPFRAEDVGGQGGWSQRPGGQEAAGPRMTMTDQAQRPPHGAPESFRPEDDREHGWN